MTTAMTTEGADRPRPAGDGPGKRAPVLVLGVGNELFRDEGLGVVAARRIGTLGLPGVEALDGATLGLALLPEIADRESVLVLDAVVRSGSEPGDVVVLLDDAVPAAWGGAVSAHQIGVPDALAAATFAGRAPRRVAVVGMVPVSLQTGVGLTPRVAAHLDAVIGRALDVLAAWGVEAPRTGTAPAGAGTGARSEAGREAPDA